MKRALAIMVIMVMAFGVAADVLATEPSGPAVDTARRSAEYTRDVATGAVKTVGQAAKGTTETAVSPVVSLWRSLTGRGRGRDVVVDPLKKGGETVRDAATGTADTVRGRR